VVLQTTIAQVDSPRADIEIFGGGGAAEIECEVAAGQDALDVMFREFVQTVDQRAAPELDVLRGLHLQRVVEEAGTDLIRTA
jgi:hypothetical protein